MAIRAKKNAGLLPNVIQAIADLQEIRGSSARNIEQHVTSAFQKKPPKEYLILGIRKALKDGIDSGLLACESGKYKIQLCPISKSPCITHSLRQAYSDLVREHKCRRRRRRRCRRRRTRCRRRRRRRRCRPTCPGPERYSRYSSRTRTPTPTPTPRPTPHPSDTATEGQTNDEQGEDDENNDSDDFVGIRKRALKPRTTRKRTNTKPKNKRAKSKITLDDSLMKPSLSRKSSKSMGRKSIKSVKDCCCSKSRKLDEANSQLNRKADICLSPQPSNTTIDVSRGNFNRRNDMDFNDSYLN